MAIGLGIGILLIIVGLARVLGSAHVEVPAPSRNGVLVP